MKQMFKIGLLCAAFVFAPMLPANAQSIFDSFKKAVGGTETRDPDRPILDQLNEAGPARETCGGDGQESLASALVEQGLGYIAEEQLFDYLQVVAAKLLANTPYPGCGVLVLATPHDAAQAVALADGGILIALGFLRNLRNEDEVAAILAHELSHVLLAHHQSDSFVASQDGFLKGLETANASGGMLLGMVDPNLSKGLDAATAVGGAVYSVSESLIAPAWTIEQEDEADLLGTDLLVAAGYNPRAMASIMNIVEAQEANAAAVESERDALYQQRLQGTLIKSAITTDVSDPLSIVGALAGVTSAAVSGSDKKTHRPASERKASVNAYIKKFYNEHRRRKFAAQPWQERLTSGESGKMFDSYAKATLARRAVFGDGDLAAAARNANAGIAGAFASDAYPRLAHSEVRLKQNERASAMASLEAAMARPSAPWQIFRSYADLQLAGGDAAGAAATVGKADKRFGEPLGIAPYAIKVFKAAGDDGAVAYYLGRCEESGSRAHIQVCQNAARGSGASGNNGGGGLPFRENSDN